MSLILFSVSLISSLIGAISGLGGGPLNIAVFLLIYEC